MVLRSLPALFLGEFKNHHHHLIVKYLIKVEFVIIIDSRSVVLICGTSMNVQKFCPPALRIYKYLKNRTSIFTWIKPISTSKTSSFNYGKINFYISLSWAFIRPAKKEDNIVTTTNVNSDTSKILEKADGLFESGHYEECYNFLNDMDVKDVEIQWRIARILYNMSKEAKYNRNEKKSFVVNAYEIISKQLQENWDNFTVQKWYAVLLDAKSSYDGVSERIKQLENVKKHMDLAVTLNPNDATTLYMLGEWCYQIAEMPWHQRKLAEVLFATPPKSTYEDALEYFLRAETAQPRFYSLNLLRLGSCYLKLEKEDQAKYYLKLAASYPAKSNDDHIANKEAAELLKRMKR